MSASKQKNRKHRGWKTKLIYGQLRARNKSRKRRVKKIPIDRPEKKFMIRPRRNRGFRF